MIGEKMIVAINYADSTYKEAQKFNTKTAYKFGKVDKVIEYGPENIDADFKERNKETFKLNDKRAGKFGLWRPHIIMDALNQAEIGDYIFYSDSGASFVKPVRNLIDIMQRDNVDIMVFDMKNNIEKFYTKRDIFVYLDCDKKKYTDTPQRCSTYFLFKKTENTLHFFKEYSELTLKAPYLFTDEENKLGYPNYPEFIDTRHNQSVLSVLSKKYGVEAYWDLSQWGIGTGIIEKIKIRKERIKLGMNYPMIMLSHRRKKVYWYTFVIIAFQNMFPKICKGLITIKAKLHK